jgi:hypothetical protein
MSISNRHTVVPFVAGTSKAMTDQRLAKIGFKKTKENPNPLKSVCISVPAITEISETQLDALMPHIVQMLEKAQDGLIRSAYEKDPSIMSVGDENIDIDACIEYLEAEETGGRMTIESLTEWFVLALANPLTEFLTMHGRKSLDGAALEKAVTQSLNGYKGMITAMAGGKTHYGASQRAKLETVLALTSDDDEISEKLMNKLVSMAKKDEKMCADLGLISFE